MPCKHEVKTTTNNKPWDNYYLCLKNVDFNGWACKKGRTLCYEEEDDNI